VSELFPAATPLPWHDQLWQQIVTTRQRGRMAHGLLVCGPPGVGKRRFAARLARALLCHAPAGDGDACGVCTSCRQWQIGSHADVSRLVPDTPGAAIRVDGIRTFTSRLQLTAQYQAGRLGWIDPAERLTIAAANSLLKTLEEPPAGTHILLISDAPDRLLPTIRSRCRRLRVPPAPVEVARQWLARQNLSTDGVDHDQLRMPLQLIDTDEDAATLAAAWRRDLARLLAGQADAVQLAEDWARQPPDALAAWLYRTASALIEYRLTGSGLADATLARQAQTQPLPRLQRLCRAAARIMALRDTNSDWQLAIESTLLESS